MVAGKIFINYRRDDSRADAGRLYDRLQARYPSRIFRDVGSLEPGVKWHDAIAKVLGSADACIVVIGRDWLSVTDSAGRRRLDDPRDPVRQEILTALNNSMRVFPVLVGGAKMPAEEELPTDLRTLAGRNALEMSEQDWDEDFKKLVSAIERSLGWDSKTLRSDLRAEGVAAAGVPEGQPPETAQASAGATPSRPRRSIAGPVAATLALFLVGGLSFGAFRLGYLTWTSHQGPEAGTTGGASAADVRAGTPPVAVQESSNSPQTAKQAASTAMPTTSAAALQSAEQKRASAPGAASKVTSALPGPLGAPPSTGDVPRPRVAGRPTESVSSDTSRGDQANQPVPGRESALTLAPGTPQSPSPAARLPQDPSVLLHCLGVPEVCAALRAAFDQALEKESLPSVRDLQRAEIAIEAKVLVIEERVDQQFGTTFAVRTYSVDLTGEALRLRESVPMPTPTTFSFDARFGRDRLTEHARVIADSAAEKVRAFWKKRVP